MKTIIVGTVTSNFAIDGGTTTTTIITDKKTSIAIITIIALPPTGVTSAFTAGFSETITIFTMTDAIPTMVAMIAGSTEAGTKGDARGGMATRTGMVVGGITRDGMTTVVAIVPLGISSVPSTEGT